MDIDSKYDYTRMKMEMLRVAYVMKEDDMYTKEKAVEGLSSIVEVIDEEMDYDDIDKKYENSLIKTKILNVASQLKNDELYTKDHAIEEMTDIIKLIEQYDAQ